MSAQDGDASKEATTPEGITDAGIVYRYPDRRRRLRLAPTPGDVVNTVSVEPWPSPTACVRLEAARFAFDSSFPHPSIATELGRLFGLRAPGVDGGDRLAVFGHADPIGDEAYNKTLAGRRAQAIYGLLTRDPEQWDELHQGAFHGDRWGAESLQTCLATLGYDVGAIDGRAGPGSPFRRALRQYKRDRGLGDDDAMDRPTRLALFGHYMDALTLDEGGAGRAYTPGDFVNEGREPHARGAMQGCGERNLALVLSKQESDALAGEAKRPERIKAQAPNRRVLVFLFRAEDVANPALWACPDVTRGPDGCAKVAWSDIDRRRSPSDKRRLVRRHGKTFGCRFYDWIARLSPCEAVRTTVQVWVRKEDGVRYDKPVDYELRTPSGFVRRGTSGDDGRVVEADVPLERHVQIAWAIPDVLAEPPALDPGPSDVPPVDTDDPYLDALGCNDESGGGDVTPLPDTPATPTRRPGPRRPDAADAPFRPSHFARVALPVAAEKRERREVLWLSNLGYRADEQNLAPTMARFALEYGLAQNAPVDDQSKLLEDVHATGREAVATDAPPVAPPDPAAAEDETTASVRPQCCCDDAPPITWTPAASTLVTPVPAFILDTRERLTALPADLLFEMPLFDGSFLGQPFSEGKSAVRDPDTGLWARDFAGARGEEPPAFRTSELSRHGVGPELKERLDWAQKRLWYYYCQERTAAGKSTSQDDFLKTWLRKEQGVVGQHSTLRSAPEASLHADGCAIDIGAGAAPFICVRGRSKPGDPSPAGARLYGERHKFDVDALGATLFTPIDPKASDDERKKTRAANRQALGSAPGFFLSDNAYEPAMAGFDRACQLGYGDFAQMQVAKWLKVKRPTTTPCDPVSDNDAYANSVVEVWDVFKKVDAAWRAYVKPTTFEAFRSDVINPSSFGGSIAIDADLVPFAESSATPPTDYVVLADPVPGDSARRQRRRTPVAVADLRGNEARARAAYFQMLRDKVNMQMAMVSGKLSFGPGAPEGKGVAIPCAWPSTWNVRVPKSRDVTQGFLGVSRTVTRAMAEAGLIWLGGTGGFDGEPIQDFTGDVMHFDLRSLKGAGSKEIDDWLAGNVARQGWSKTIDDVAKLVGANSDSLGLSAGSARARLRKVVVRAAQIPDPSTVIPKLESAAKAATARGDDDLVRLVGDARAALDGFIESRSRLQAAYQFAPGQSAQRHLITLGAALKAAHMSTTSDEASAARDRCKATAAAIELGVQAIGDAEKLVKQASALASQLDALAKHATDTGRRSAEAAVKAFDAKQDAFATLVGGSL